MCLSNKCFFAKKDRESRRGGHPLSCCAQKKGKKKCCDSKFKLKNKY